MQDKNIDAYIEKQKSPQKEICKKLRKLIFKTLPKVKEEMKWGVPTYDNGNYYMVALKDHVNLGFSIKGLPKEKLALLEGSGKTMKHLEIKETKNMNEKKIILLLKLIKNK